MLEGNQNLISGPLLAATSIFCEGTRTRLANQWAPYMVSSSYRAHLSQTAAGEDWRFDSSDKLCLGQLS